MHAGGWCEKPITCSQHAHTYVARLLLLFLPALMIVLFSSPTNLGSYPSLPIAPGAGSTSKA